MKIIAAVPTLTGLAIRGTPISDAGVAHLSNGPQLTELYLDSKLTAVGLAALAKSQRSLKQLELGPTITPDAVPSLADHPTLSRLDLHTGHLSDANIRTLRSLPGLQQLYVYGSFDGDILARIAQVTRLRGLSL